MFVDASALTSMFLGEHDASELVGRVVGADVRITSPLSVWEASIAVCRQLALPVARASHEMHAYLVLLGIEIRPVPTAASRLALEAFDRYGKGRHPAALNFGDCFSYACARHFGEPLLYKGSDFALTDIKAA